MIAFASSYPLASLAITSSQEDRTRSHFFCSVLAPPPSVRFISIKSSLFFPSFPWYTMRRSQRPFRSHSFLFLFRTDLYGVRVWFGIAVYSTIFPVCSKSCWRYFATFSCSSSSFGIGSSHFEIRSSSFFDSFFLPCIALYCAAVIFAIIFYFVKFPKLFLSFRIL